MYVNAMKSSYFLTYLRSLRYTKSYFYLSLLYGLSTLLIPFGVQLLVNNLALTGLWVSTFSFLILISIGFLITLFVKYVQFILVEFMQRSMLVGELDDWFKKTRPENSQSPYFIEMFTILKSFSLILNEGMDIILTFSFGVLAIALIHPAFLLISILLCLSIVLLTYIGTNAIKTSNEESGQKYALYDQLDRKDHESFTTTVHSYFTSREAHYRIVKKQAILIYSSCFILQMILLAWGIHLIQINELSLGQLVSAEIISSNIFMNFLKLPKILDTYYDFETGCYKLNYGKGLIP